MASPPSGVANLMSHGEHQDVRTETSLVADRDRAYGLDGAAPIDQGIDPNG